MIVIVAAITAPWALLVQQREPNFLPSIFGNLTTFFEIALVFVTVLVLAYPETNLGFVIHALIYIVAAFATFSAFHYSFAVTKHHANP